MARLTNVRMRSMLLLVQFVSTICSGIEFRQPDELFSVNGELNATLVFGDVTVNYFDSGLIAKGQAVDKFHTLGFNGKTPGPTLRVRAGDTVRIRLMNVLPPELVSTATVKINKFREFDVVNLHTHGLHVSPRKPGDEVVKTRVNAGDYHDYVYHIPKDHMGGTHWYHAHWHGSVSIHVNFGAAGMIIVEDAVNQLPDELLGVGQGGPVEDYIVATYHIDFDQINTITKEYIDNCKALRDKTKEGVTEKEANDCTDVMNCPDGPKCYACAAEKCDDQAQRFEADLPGDDHGATLILVNGQFQPTLEITANTWVRLRLGFMATGYILAPKLLPLPSFGQCQIQLLAKDGVYLPTAPRTITQGMLSSGNRADVLINCPEGEFDFNSTALISDDNGKPNVNQVVGCGQLTKGGTCSERPERLLRINAVASLSVDHVCDLPVFEVNRPCYLVDLREQTDVAKNLTFAMTYPTISNATPVKFSYDPNKIDYTLPVGKVVGLNLSYVNGHPFHIHINPFQLTKNGKGDQWEKDWFQSGDWQDTMYNPEDGTQRVLMQTDFFTGPTVVHCHILGHEDIGMMVVVNFTGKEGARYPPAYGVSAGSGETCRDPTTPVIDPTCYTSTPLIDANCYSSSLEVIKPSEDGTRIGTCNPPPPPPPNAFVFKVATATAEANTWKVTAIVLGVVLVAVLLLVAAVFVRLAMRGTANSGAAASGAGAGGQEMM